MRIPARKLPVQAFNHLCRLIILKADVNALVASAICVPDSMHVSLPCHTQHLLSWSRLAGHSSKRAAGTNGNLF